MAHNRVITINTSSEVLQKLVFSTLFYLNITEERILQDANYPASNETIESFAKVKEFITGLNYLFTSDVTDDDKADSEYNYEIFVLNEVEKLGRI